MKALQKASFISFGLACSKGLAFALTGSFVVLASFLDSTMDAVLSWFNFKMSQRAKDDADREHPYGHGGLEVVSSLIQGLFISGSGLYVIWRCVERYRSGALASVDVERIPVAVGIMTVSAIAGLIIMQVLNKQRKINSQQSQRSLSLNSDYAHYAGDAIYNLLSIVALVITYYFHMPVVDVVAGAVSGLFLIWNAFPLLRDSYRDIMNTDVDHLLRVRIQKIVGESNIPQVQGIHRLRMRTLGPIQFIDFHLKLPAEMSLRDAHAISDRIETLIYRDMPNVDVLIHLDPDSEPDHDIE